jgi:hypothetical protein
METKDFIKFIDDLALIKDVVKKNELIKNEIKMLDRMIREGDKHDCSSRMEKLEKQTEYMEILSYKSVLSFRLSVLQSNDNLE